ncbi:acyl-CoA dehydrogenase family protein [Streptomyces glaucosporus]|uniref:Acyl-CoA dehydrogenase family protein n=1 Tax=Streptomyces glaucosporus TaxID=284044 RepID=A0ABP5VVW6_9ACTN
MPRTTHTPGGGPAPLTGHDVFSSDRALAEGVARHAAGERAGELRAGLAALGRAAGSAEVLEWGARAAARPPEPWDGGAGADPSWHRLLDRAAAAGLTGAPPGPAARLRRTAALLVWAQVGTGQCPALSAAHAAAAGVRADPDRNADPEHAAVREPAAGYGGGPRLPAGTVVPEGPDGVRAEPGSGGPEGAGYVLAGRGRLRPAAPADVLLVRAGTAGGESWFLMPWTLPDGARNGLRVRRPADGAGGPDPSAAVVEFDGTARAWRIAAETTGALRADRVACSAAVLRQAVVRAVHHAAHHGGPPGGEALTRNVLADLAVESEAATALALRLAAAHDAGADRDRALLRTAVPAAAYWLAGRCAPAAAEAWDLLGGDGCAGGPGIPPLPREAPDPAGESGGALALEVLRVVRGDPEALTAFLTEIGRARGADHRLDGAIRELLGELAELEGIEARARRLAERMVLVLQGALLVRHAPPEVADAFCASRLGGERGTAFGTLPPALDLAAIVERARPAAG